MGGPEDSRVAKEPEQVHRTHGCRRKNRSFGLELRQGQLEASVALKHKSSTGWGDKGLSKTLFKGKFGLTDEMLRRRTVWPSASGGS